MGRRPPASTDDLAAHVEVFPTQVNRTHPTLDPSDLENTLRLAYVHWQKQIEPLPPDVDCDSLLSAAYLGALKAHRTYDPSRGTRYRTWVIYNVRWEMLMERRRLDSMSYRRYQTPYEETPQEFQGILNVTEITFRFNPASDDGIEEVGIMIDPVDAESDVDPEAELLAQEHSEALQGLISRLPEEMQKILRMRYWEERTKYETARLLGRSEALVRKLERLALATLRQELEKNES